MEYIDLKAQYRLLKLSTKVEKLCVSEEFKNAQSALSNKIKLALDDLNNKTYYKITSLSSVHSNQSTDLLNFKELLSKGCRCIFASDIIQSKDITYLLVAYDNGVKLVNNNKKFNVEEISERTFNSLIHLSLRNID